METDIQNIKIELIQWLTTLNDKSTIQQVLDVRDKETNDWSDELSNAEKESIELGIMDADNGNVVSHSKARKVYEKWL